MGSDPAQLERQNRCYRPDPRGMDNPVLFFYLPCQTWARVHSQTLRRHGASRSRATIGSRGWLASGRYSLCSPVFPDEMDKALDQGLPVGQFFGSKKAAP